MALKKVVEAVKKATTKTKEVEVVSSKCSICNGIGRVSERVSCEECQGTGLGK